jgi:ferredoxin
MSTGKNFTVTEVGYFEPGSYSPTDILYAGEVGYVSASIKSLSDIRVGDTVTNDERPAEKALAGYKKAIPMVYCGIYPMDGSDYENLKVALEKLKLNDAALEYEPETSRALGSGFRCGFLGLLHLEIIEERLDREFNLGLITTAPSVIYKVHKIDGTVEDLYNPSDLPESTSIKFVEEPNAKVLLFFGNKNSQNILLKEELDALKAQFSERFQVTHVLSREPQEDTLFEGRITTEKLGQLLDKNSEIKPEDSTFFICGPTEMIKSTSDFLKKERKVPALQVLYEYFSAPEDEDNAEMSEEFKKIPNLESFVTLIIDDDEYSIHLNSKKESILDKALKENLPVPFACKGGVCCTCKAQVMEGEVFMEKNFALTEDEVARGFVLTCQCHPTTNIVMLNYDV